MRYLLVLLLGAAVVACSDEAGSGGSSNGGTTPAPGTSDPTPTIDPDVFASGTEVRIPVNATRAYLKLSSASVSTEADWDLAFEGWDIFTNSGVSGSGAGGAFGPLEPTTYLGDIAPAIPFITADKTGGAFLDWYAYDGSSHALWTKYHVYGVKDGERLWKVQVLGYYGQRDGAAVTALYSLRYAEITSTGVGPTQEVTTFDGTAGGLAAPATSPSECIDFGTGARTMLTPAQAELSSAWHVCVRRSYITVNGELGGPRNIGAFDATTGDTAAVDEVMKRTADTEKAAFDAIDAGTFTGKTFRGDRIVSAFGDLWADRAARASRGDAWIVLDGAGKQKYMVAFTGFEGASDTSPGVIVLRVKPVSG